MTRFDLWRFFGALPESTPDSFDRDPDQILAEGIAEFRRNDESSVAPLLAFALRFGRLDALRDVLDPESWGDTGDAALQRGRLHLFRALAENPSEPSLKILSRAAEEFRRALDDSRSAWDAVAGLLRIHVLLGETRRARSYWHRLVFGGRTGRIAAAGACLFLAERPDRSPTVRRWMLRTALVLMAGNRSDPALEGVRREIRDRLGYRSLESVSDPETVIRWILRRAAELQTSPSPEPDELDAVLHDIAVYRRVHPADPRPFLAEGDLLVRSDPESARMAWRSALVLDDRFADAWSRLGDIYREAWMDGDEELRSSWMEAARDAYLKAMALDPLVPGHRAALGVLARENGESARAVAEFTAALGLLPDDPTIRRWLASCWLDLASDDRLPPATRSAAASRAKTEWSRLWRSVHRDATDLLGLLRAEALGESPGDDLNRRLRHLLAVLPPGDREDLVVLAEDFTAAGFDASAWEVLDHLEAQGVDDGRTAGMRGRILSDDSPREAVAHFLRAADSPGSRPEEIAAWIRFAADASAAAGDPEQAASILRRTWERFPEDPELTGALAGRLAALGRTDEAAGVYRRSLETRPGDPDLVENAAWFLRTLDRDAEALAVLERGLESRPDEPRIWNQKGVHHMETGWDDERNAMTPEDLESAVAAYRKALDLAPEESVYAGNLGDALRQAGRWIEASKLLEQAGDEAFALNSRARLEDERSYSGDESGSMDDWYAAGDHYRRAVRLGADNVDYHRDLAWWLYRERRLEDAIAAYRRAAELDPGDETLPYGEAVCRRELGDEEGALEALGRALEARPGDPEISLDQADLLADSGRTDEAEALYDAVLAATDSASWVLIRLAELRQKTADAAAGPPRIPLLSADGISPDPGELVPGPAATDPAAAHRRAALRSWIQALNSDPDNRWLRSRTGAAWMDIGRSDKARDLLTASLVHGGDPADAEALNRLGRLDLADGLADRAADRLEAAVERNPLSAAYLADLAFSRVLQDRFDSALESYRNAADRDPEAAEYAANAGICAYRCGLYDDGVALLDRALALRDSAPEWRNAQGLCLLAAGTPEAALEAFRSACLEDPRSEVYPANLALAHERIRVPDHRIQ